MKTKASTAGDWAISLPTTHDFLSPSPPFAMTFPTAFAMEVPVPMGWVAGMFSHKLATTVLHRKQPVVQDGHNVGMGIIHLHFVPLSPNLLNITQSIFSERKTNFGCSTVKVGKAPAGACLMTQLPPTPMSSCGDPMSLIATDATSAHFNTLNMGITFMDLLSGYAAVFVDMLIDAVFYALSPPGAGALASNQIGKKLSDAAKKEMWEKGKKALQQQVYEKAFGGLAGNPKKFLVKAAVGVGSGVIKLVRTGEAEFGLSGGGFATMDIKVKVNARSDREGPVIEEASFSREGAVAGGIKKDFKDDSVKVDGNLGKGRAKGEAVYKDGTIKTKTNKNPEQTWEPGDWAEDLT